MKYIVLYTAQKLKKDKVWHDGVLVVTEGHGILMDDSGKVISRESMRGANLSVDSSIDTSRYIIYIKECIQDDEGEATSKDSTRSRHRQPTHFRCQYTDNVNAALADGIAEYDGKSMVVFKDADTGKQIGKKICPGISEQETVTVGKYFVTILEPIEQTCGQKGFFGRKTLVCKMASAAATIPSPNDGNNGNNSASATNDGLITKKCIYTEDKQKRIKKWIDGIIKVNNLTNHAVIENEDSGEVIYKRHFNDPDCLVDGYEFEGGRFRFQITEPNIEEPVMHKFEPMAKRKRLMTVGEIMDKKQEVFDNKGRLAENNPSKTNQYIRSQPNEFRRPKQDSLFDLFDDE